jgi:hypothetical protein
VSEIGVHLLPRSPLLLHVFIFVSVITVLEKITLSFCFVILKPFISFLLAAFKIQTTTAKELLTHVDIELWGTEEFVNSGGHGIMLKAV